MKTGTKVRYQHEAGGKPRTGYILHAREDGTWLVLGSNRDAHGKRPCHIVRAAAITKAGR